MLRLAVPISLACYTTGALNSTTISLPKDPLQKGKVSLDGTISITDQKQATVASIQVQVTIE